MRIEHPVLRGFEFTGEFRAPQANEWYWETSALRCGGYARVNGQSRLILRKVRSTDLDDYELTGAWRRPVDGDVFLGYDGATSVVRFAGAAYYSTFFHILREKVCRIAQREAS